MSEKIEEANIVDEKVLTEKPEEVKELSEEQKEMLFYMNLMNDPVRADEMFRNEQEYKKFKELFGDKKCKVCNRKGCGRLHLKVKGEKFCCKECEKIYKKETE